MNLNHLQVLTTEVHQLLRLREDLMRQRDKADDSQEQDRLSALITEINENGVPNLRERIRAAFNDSKGTTKHQLSELAGKVDEALIGIGTFRDVDVSEARLHLLRKQQPNARSHREAKQIGNEIRAIERARSLLKEQQRVIANEQSRREQNEAEIRCLDEILYGHLQKKELRVPTSALTVRQHAFRRFSRD